jgi:hypothetical protein
VAAGERGADGQFPEATINRRVETRLGSMAEAVRRFRTNRSPRWR